MLFKGKRVWVTGASGTIGGAIAKRFLQEDCVVYVERTDLTNFVDISNKAFFFRPDVLINCAGVYIKGSVYESFIPDWEKTIGTNLTGCYYLTKVAIASMKNKGGKIIHMSGGGAAYGRPFYSAYAASKAGLVRFIECVAEEVKEFNIQINAIAPGSVKSRMNPQGTETPDKAVELALYLASEESNHVTGRLIHVNEDYRKPLSEEAGKLRRIPL